MLLAQLGADVIVVEPPGGSSARKQGPFFHDNPDPENSLFWLGYNVNKRGITLDITKNEGRDILLDLAKKSDIVIEEFRPGYLDAINCGYNVLSSVKKDIIMVSITPFGQQGPYRDYCSSDLTLMALGGHAYLSGDPDREPLCVAVPQTYLLAGAHSAMVSLIALWHRDMTGTGQQIDISLHECATWISFVSFNFWDFQQIILKREGHWRAHGDKHRMRTVYPCKDGYVCLWVLGGSAGAKGQNNLRMWALSEGLVDDFWKDFDYENWDAYRTTQDICDRLAESIDKFLVTKTKEELYRAATKKGIYLAPVNSISDVLDDEQLKFRDFWVQLEYPEMGVSLTHPGDFVKAIYESTVVTKWRRAPHIGEHNKDVYSSLLGITDDDLKKMKSRGVI